MEEAPGLEVENLMPVTMKVQLIGEEKFERVTHQLSPRKNTRITAGALEEIAQLADSIITTETIVRGRSGLPPLPDRLTSRTAGKGGAIGSIGVDLSGLPRQSVVGSDLFYPLLHEEGWGVLPERKWMEPAIDKIIPDRAEAITIRHWERQAGSAR